MQGGSHQNARRAPVFLSGALIAACAVVFAPANAARADVAAGSCMERAESVTVSEPIEAELAIDRERAAWLAGRWEVAAGYVGPMRVPSDGPLQWCASEEDPSCQQDLAPPGGGIEFGSSPSGADHEGWALTKDSWTPPSRGQVHARPTTESGPDGFRARAFRPPQR